MSDRLIQQEQMHRRRYEFAKMIFIVTGTLTSIVVLSIMLNALAVLQGVTEGTSRNSEILIDCTSPSGKCFQEGQRRTGEAVGTINQVSIYAAYCSKVPANDTVTKIENCIKKELEKDPK